MLDDGKVNELVIVKGCERYIFRWTDANRGEMIQRAAGYAADPKRRFKAYDLDVLKQASKPGSTFLAAVGNT